MYDVSVTTATPDFLPVIFIPSLIIYVIGIVAMWKIFEKAGKPGWASIVPFYHAYTLFEVAGMNGWMFLLMFVPIANIVAMVMVCSGLAKSFGKSTGFAVGLFFLGFIFMMILGFGSDKYVGTSSK